MPEKTDKKKFGEELKKFRKQTSVENEESTEVYISNFMKSQNQTSRSPENKLQEVYISNPNNTNLSDTEMNDNKSNPIISVDEKRFDSDNRSEDYQAYENLVKETIDYESLEVTHHDDMRQVDEIVNLIVETVMCKHDKILIASNWYPASLVMRLNAPPGIINTAGILCLSVLSFLLPSRSQKGSAIPAVIISSQQVLK